MNESTEFVVSTLAIGAGATLAMDAWALLLRQLGIPSLDFALLGRWIAHLEDLVPLHRRYVEIVREVARQKWVVLCDAAAEFEALPQDLVRDELFMADGIHFTDEGNKALAAAILECLRQNDLVGGGRPQPD